MLSKTLRLPAKDISSVLKSGKRQNFKYFSISSLPAVALAKAGPQISVIVSNKIDNRSTARNKIKRRLKEAIQKNLDKFKNKKIIFFAKKEILTAKYSEISDEINKIVL